MQVNLSGAVAAVGNFAREAALESSGFMSTTHVAGEWIQNAGKATLLGDLETAHHFATAARGDLGFLAAAEPTRIPGAVGAIVEQGRASVDGFALQRLDESIRLLAGGSRSDRAAVMNGLQDAWQTIENARSTARRAVYALEL